MNDGQRLQHLRPRLEQRHRLVEAIRSFFTDHGFLEVDTPIRIPAPALEDYIDAEPAGTAFLRTSPELHLKRLLAAGYERLFQMGPCFRQGESGRLHQPEFTMLEWYRAAADYRDMYADTRDLLRHACARVTGGDVCSFRGHQVPLTGPWEELTVDAAFERYAGQSVAAVLAAGPGAFEQTLVEQIEPHLGYRTPTILLDYPVEFGGLACRKSADPTRVERWELYIAGLEIANAYSELTEATEQRRRFTACAELRRSQQRAVYPLDEEFLTALDHGMPRAGGIALGVDRLLMVLTGAERIQDVVAFPTAAD